MTVDLDNTLISTQQDYTIASELFGDWMKVKYGVVPERAVEVQKRYDKENLEKFGLSVDRYPKSFVQALNELANHPSEEEQFTAEQIGYSAYKTEFQYRHRGFMENAEEMVDALRDVADSLHLVTVGDSRLQEPKIRALDLKDKFDSTHVVPYDANDYEESKTGALINIRESESVSKENMWHIGDSLSSDCDAALEAGIQAVHISDSPDWLTRHNGSEYDHSTNKDVYQFNNRQDFIDKIPVMFA